MSSLTHVIRLPDPAGEHVVELVRRGDAELVRKQAFRVRLRAHDPQLLVADMADLDSVKRLAAGLRDHTIDVLVNNADIMMPPRSLSPQGHESLFATNHLGHFALTGLLLDQITDRVVTVRSGLHRSGSIHWDDLTGAKKYSPTASTRNPSSPTSCSD